MGISLRLVVVALVAVVAILAAVISLVPVQRAGFKAVRDTAQLLRFEVRERLSAQIEIFFTSPMAGVNSFRDVNRLNLLTMNDYQSIVPALMALGRSVGLVMYAGFDTTEFFYANSVTRGASTCFHAYALNATARRGASSRFNENNWTMTPEGPPFVTGYNPMLRPWYPVLYAGQGWSPIYMNRDGKSAALTLGAPIMDTTYTTKIGVVGVDIVTTSLIQWFLGISVGKTGRAILLETKSQASLGGNWNESATVKLNHSISDDDPTRSVSTNYRLATLGDYQDMTLRRTVAAIGAAEIFTVPLPYSASFDSGLNTVHVDIVNISDSYGLALRLMIMLPEKDFLQDVKKQVDISIGIVVACVVVLMVIAIVITFLLMQPLAALEARMYASASFEDVGEDESSSIISEVANIQEAYAKMQAELRRVKSFLPKSVLARLEAEDDEEESNLDQQTKLTDTQHSASASASASEKQSARASHRSAGSRRSASVYAEKKAVRGLFVDEGLTSKKITVLSLNLRNFHNISADGNWRPAVALQKTFLQSIETHTRRFKGVVDSFNGDHVIVTFNAVTAAASHQSKACLTYLSVLEDMQNVDNFAGLTCGIASGEALVGNIGSEGLKRFCTVGKLFNQVTILERLCLQYDVSALVTSAVANAAQYDVSYVATTVANLPGSKKIGVLSTLVAKKVAGDDEWMYDLENGKKGDILTPISEAFKVYAEGDLVKAQSLTESLTEGHPSVMRLKSMVSTPPEDLAALQGTYYEASYLH